MTEEELKEKISKLSSAIGNVTLTHEETIPKHEDKIFIFMHAVALTLGSRLGCIPVEWDELEPIINEFFKLLKDQTQTYRKLIDEVQSNNSVHAKRCSADDVSDSDVSSAGKGL
jgi:hypothetical protein